jgi:phage-related minor tail protein
MAGGEGVELATAYLSLVPSMKGTEKTIASQVGGATKAAGAQAEKDIAGGITKGGESGGKGLRGFLSKQFGGLGEELSGGIKAALGGLVIGGALKGLYDLGSEFDDMADTIRVGTGATGKALDGLVSDAKKVGSEVPDSFEEVGQTVADLNTRLGLTGPQLQKLSRQFLEAGKITGQALDVNKFTAAFNAFDVQGGKTSDVLDEFYRVSQATGIGMNDLATQVANQAPILKQFGFSADDSAELVGTLDKAGINVSRTMATLSPAMIQFAKAGKSPKKGLEDTVKQIQAFTKAGDDASALKLAGSIFGTRGASQFVGALKSGKVNLDNLKKSTGETKDTIDKATEDTDDFAEKWKIFTNQLKLKLEPAASEVFNLMSEGMDYLSDHSSVLKEIAAGIGAIVATWAAVKIVNGIAATYSAAVQVIAGVTKVWAAGQAILNAVMEANPIFLIIGGLVALGAALVVAYKKSETFRDIVNGAFGIIKSAAAAVVGFFTNDVPAAFGAVKSAASSVISWVKGHWSALTGILSAPIGAAADAISGSWNAIVGGVKSLIGKIRGLAGNFGDAGRALIHAFVDGMKNAGGIISGIAGNVWDAVKSLLNSAISKINSALDFTIHIPGPDIHINAGKIPHFAAGTNFYPGGIGLVGENGPELVSLPRGSQITPARQTAAMMRVATPASTASASSSDQLGLIERVLEAVSRQPHVLTMTPRTGAAMLQFQQNALGNLV